MSKISIIVPFYNEAETLSFCLSSLLQQTMKDITIILIDDGSTDNSLEIAEQFINGTQHILIQTPHEGPGNARNEGLKYVTSQYVAFVDADDILLSNGCQLLLDAASFYNADIVFGGQGEFDALKTIIPVRYLEWLLKIEENLNLRNYFKSAVGSPVVTGKLFRTDLILSHGILFPVNCDAEDTVYAIASWACAKEIHTINKIIYARNPFYRIKKTGSLKIVEDRFKVIEMIDDICDKYNLASVKYDARIAIFGTAFKYLVQINNVKEKKTALNIVFDFLKKNREVTDQLKMLVGLSYQELNDLDLHELTETNYLYWKIKSKLVRQLETH